MKKLRASLATALTAMLISGTCAAKTPVDQLLDVLMGPELGSRRGFTCKEAIGGKITDENAYYEFGRGDDYRRLNSYVDPRLNVGNPANIRGSFDVKIEDRMLKIVFWDKYAPMFIEGRDTYSAIVIETDGKDTMALMMDRPVPGRNHIKDHVRLLCTGHKPTDGTGKQRSY